MKALAQNFILNDLKLPKDQYQNTKISKIWDEVRQNHEIINVTFNGKDDIARINTNLKNLNKENSNKIYQYVPKSILSRYKGFEEAAYRVRIDNKNGVNTKIRAGKDDLVLLVRNKSDKTPWNMIHQTVIPLDLEADFEVGELTKEDKITEKKNNKIKHEKKKFKTKTDFTSTNIYNFLTIEDSIDRFLVQNEIDVQ